MASTANIPMKFIGPIKIIGNEFNKDIKVPLATFETPLWPSTNRGAKVSMLTEGINANILSESMTRSVAVSAANSTTAINAAKSIKQRLPELKKVVSQTSRFAELQEVHSEQVGKIIYLRFAITSGDASGHNMVTKASDAILSWLAEQYPELEYVSVSGNYCTDKKVSAVNGILGRGKSVIADIVIPRKICEKLLRTTPEKIVDLNIKKNLLGSILAGSLRSANAHYANMLLAFYLATGQDAANIIEGSQGITFCELQGEDLYFSVNLPNIIVGTVGNGKELDFVRENLQAMGLTDEAEPGTNARHLALITAAIVLCCELSLLAALTNPGELMRSHISIERQNSQKENS